MTEARIIAPLSAPVFNEIKKADNKMALRLAFIGPEKKREISLFINADAVNFTYLKGSVHNTYFINLNYRSMPPEDFIEIIGNLLENELNDEKRIHDRIAINDLTHRPLGSLPLESFLFIEGSAKKCILSEISIMSAKVIINGSHEEFRNKKGLLIIKNQALSGKGEMVGQITRTEDISTSPRLIALVIVFDQDAVPPQYKMWIGECLETLALKQRK